MEAVNINHTKNLLGISGCKNFRDLGGIAFEGGFTACNKFYRSDGLFRLTEKDIELLKEAGVNCVIDLRSSTELERSPNPLKDREDFRYYNISLFSGIKRHNYIGGRAETIPAMYRDLLMESGQLIGQVFKTMISHENGAIVYHCSEGKDRTGIISALLLKLAGVSDEDVIDNYSVSYSLMREIFDKTKAEMRKMGREPIEELFMTKPEYMRGALDILESSFGGAKKYLQRFLSQNEITALESMIKAC